jgi:hypothetical protein
MSQEEGVLVLSLEDSDSERFEIAEAGSSADEMDDCLSIVLEVEGLAVAEATGPKTSEMPAGAEAPGSDESSGNSYGMGCPMEGCGKWVTDLRGHCVQAHIPEVFQTTLRVLGGSGGDLFGYAAGLLSAIGYLEGHSVKPVEVAAMREVCRVGGWVITSEFSLTPPTPELSSSINTLKSPHRAVRAHARP